MDPLSDALGAVRSRDGVLHRSELCAPYGMLIDERSPLTVLLLLEGSGWLVFADGEEVELTRGVVHLVSCPEPHRVLDAPGSPVRILIDPEGARTVEGGRLPAPADEVRCLVEEPGDGTRTVMVSGNYAVAAGAGRRLLAALPRVARVGLPEVTHLVALLEAELERSAPGRQPVLDRWLDLVLTTALRAWADDASTGPAWAAAMADPQLGGVLRALHGDPARSWTVERMARVAGLSQRLRGAVHRPRRPRPAGLPDRAAHGPRHRPPARGLGPAGDRGPRRRLREPVRLQRGVQADPRDPAVAGARGGLSDAGRASGPSARSEFLEVVGKGVHTHHLEELGGGCGAGREGTASPGQGCRARRRPPCPTCSDGA